MRRRRPVLDQEKKDLTSTQAITANNAGTITLLNGLAQGVGVSQRIGRRALMVNLSIKYCVGLQATNQSPQCYRISLVLDRWPQGSFPDLDQIYTNNGGSQAPLGFRDLRNSNRFKILKTRLLQMDQGNLAKRGSMFLRMRVSTLYVDVNAAIADISHNALYLVLLSDQAGTGDPSAAPTYNGVIRLRFTG